MLHAARIFPQLASLFWEKFPVFQGKVALVVFLNVLFLNGKTSRETFFTYFKLHYKECLIQTTPQHL